MEDGGLRSHPHLAFQHPYPPTKLMWVPDADASRPDLLATSGDFLRVWRVGEEGVQLEKLLNNVSGNDACRCMGGSVFMSACRRGGGAGEKAAKQR